MISATSWSYVLAFIAGAAFEAACVFWVHFSEKGQPFKTALVSMVVGLSQVLGIGESIHDRTAAAFYVLGYGFGTYWAVKLKMTKRSEAA